LPTIRDRHAAVLDLPLRLEGAGGSQSSRVHAGLRAAILDGRLAAGLRLPSSRLLAEQLGVRRNAVVVAYELLLSDGLAEARVGDGTYVAAQVPRGAAAPDPVAAPAGIQTASPGRSTASAQSRSPCCVPLVMRIRLGSQAMPRVAARCFAMALRSASHPRGSP
jgi:GntR family transcriptional regulator/MocR family aminotransferase